MNSERVRRPDIGGASARDVTNTSGSAPKPPAYFVSLFSTVNPEEKCGCFRILFLFV